MQTYQVQSFFALTLITSASLSYAAPYTPKSDDEVLQRLSTNHAQARVPNTLFSMNNSQRIRYAARALKKAKQTGDVVFYDHAEAALLPWRDQKPSPSNNAASPIPMSVLRSRARIHQHHHRFDAAITDLSALLKQTPNDADALLSRASIHTVLGNYSAAKVDCSTMPTTDSTSKLARQMCLWHLDSLTGKLQASSQTLHSQIDAIPVAFNQWAWSLLAEMATRSGDKSLAEEAYQKALALDEHDDPSRIGYLWWLLDQKAYDLVITTANNKLESDGVAVAAVAAHKGKGDTKAADALSNDLKKRFHLARLRNEKPHTREEAQLALIEGRMGNAFVLAKKNWETQREPLDTLLLLNIAKQLKNEAVINEITQWLANNQQEDKRHD